MLRVQQQLVLDKIFKISVFYFKETSSSLLSLNKSMLSLKILRKLIIHGLKRPHEHNETMLFIEKSFEETRTLLQVKILK